MKQLKEINARMSEWERLDTVVLAISNNTPEDNAKNLRSNDMPRIRLLSDSGFANARRYRSYDDFEEMELHSTILIDKKGRMHWARSGGAPFEKMDFLIEQLGRMNAAVEAEKSVAQQADLSKNQLHPATKLFFCTPRRAQSPPSCAGSTSA